MTRLAIRLAAALGLALALGACVVEEVPGPAPYPGYHWVPGHYGPYGGWVRGHWQA